MVLMTSPLLVLLFAPCLLSQGLSQAPTCDGVANCDSDGFLYQPILCSAVEECSCTLGTARCNICPNDGGSDFVTFDVCQCTGVSTREDGVECNPSKSGGPSRSVATVAPSMSTTPAEVIETTEPTRATEAETVAETTATDPLPVDEPTSANKSPDSQGETGGMDSSSSDSVEPEPNNSSSNSNGLMIGLGVAAGLAVLSCCIGVAACILMRRKRSDSPAGENEREQEMPIVEETRIPVFPEVAPINGLQTEKLRPVVYRNDFWQGQGEQESSSPPSSRPFTSSDRLSGNDYVSSTTGSIPSPFGHERFELLDASLENAMKKESF